MNRVELEHLVTRTVLAHVRSALLENSIQTMKQLNANLALKAKLLLLQVSLAANRAPAASKKRITTSVLLAPLGLIV